MCALVFHNEKKKGEEEFVIGVVDQQKERGEREKQNKKTKMKEKRK